MNIKLITFLFVFCCTSTVVLAQNDFSIRWSVHTSGDTVEENPFAGSFIIKNEGESTIMASDTIWYGYWVDEIPYDLGFNPDLVTGRVLETDFMPGDEITVTNNFSWPLLGSGVTVELCVVVYGEGIESFESIYFLGDDNTENNTDCIFAILPNYTVSIDEGFEKEPVLFTCYFSQDMITINQLSNQIVERASIIVTNLNGKIVSNIESNLLHGQNQIPVTNLSQGVYLVSIIIAETTYCYKVFRL